MLSAIAIQENFSTSKHKQLIGWFNKNIIHPGKIDRKFSKLIYTIFENREKSDYDILFRLTRAEVVNSLEETKELLPILSRLIAGA